MLADTDWNGFLIPVAAAIPVAGLAWWTNYILKKYEKKRDQERVDREDELNDRIRHAVDEALIPHMAEEERLRMVSIEEQRSQIKTLKRDAKFRHREILRRLDVVEAKISD